MNYNGREFDHFSITTELQQGIVGYLKTNEIKNNVRQSLEDRIQAIKEKYSKDFFTYVEVEDRSTVILTVHGCDKVEIIDDFRDIVEDQFNQANLFIYFEAEKDDYVGECISDKDDDFDFGLLS